MKTKKVLSIVLASALVASLGMTVTAEEEGDKKITNLAVNDLAYEGDLTIFHYSTSEEAEGNGASDGFRRVLDAWDEAHPEINLNQEVLANEEYVTQVATEAAAGDLPDVFLLQGMNTVNWAEQGLVMDLTDIIAESPYYDDYNTALFTPFTTADGRIYGYPSHTGGTSTVVVYDKEMWAEAGYDEFPTTWDEVEAAVDYFSEQGIDTIAFGNGGQWQANSDFLSTLGNRYTGPDWFQSLINKDGAAFTDQAFIDALTETQYLFYDTEIFNEDFNAVTNEDAREYYIAGDAAAFIGGSWDESYIAASLKETDEEKYNNMAFAVLPQPADATYAPNSQNFGLGYAIAFNPDLADDPDKLAAAIDLAQEITGPAYATFVAKYYALGGLTRAEDVDLSAFDDVTVAFYNWTYLDTETCEIYNSYINSAVWDILDRDMQTMMNGDMTPEEVAENAQAAYEENY